MGRTAVATAITETAATALKWQTEMAILSPDRRYGRLSVRGIDTVRVLDLMRFFNHQDLR
jgi:hypothetical protein